MVPHTVLDGWQQQQPASQDCGCSHKSDAAIIDGEIQQLLGKGVLEETDPAYGQYVLHFPQEEEKWFLQINLESKRIECIHRVSTI